RPPVSRHPSTAACPPLRPTAWGASRSASMCMCRSARPGAATATSTPIPPPNSAAGPAARPTPARRTPGPGPRGASARPVPPEAATVFCGGGTPTLLPPAHLAQILRAIDGEFGLAPGCEVTVEANPETVDERSLAQLRAGGVTRISLGMQSAVPHVLAVLDRVHRPGRPAQCARWA